MSSRISSSLARSLQAKAINPVSVSRPACVPVRGFAKSAVAFEEYDKHRVQTTTPSAGTTTPIVQTYTEPGTRSELDMSYQMGSRQRTLSTFDMSGKVCIITGGARGLGQMFARTLVEAGATEIAILDLKQEDADQAAQEMTEFFEGEGPDKVPKGQMKVTGYACDVASEESVQTVFDSVVKKYGKLDVMINSAGIVENFPAEDYPTAKLRKLVDINIMGSYFVAREAAKRMKKGSSIVLIGSMSGLVINVPQPQSPYNMSKAAVIHMAKSLAVEWAPRGIRVNSISPGYVLTNLTKVILDANHELRDTWVNMTPMGRLADPQDLKGAIVYLASDASAFTTGSNMVIDGGYTWYVAADSDSSGFANAQIYNPNPTARRKPPQVRSTTMQA